MLKDKIYIIVRKSEVIQLAHYDCDFHEYTANDTMQLKSDQIYKFLRESTYSNIYYYQEGGKILRSPLRSYLNNPNFIVFTDRDALDYYLTN